MNGPLELTFGVELEFILISSDEDLDRFAAYNGDATGGGYHQIAFRLVAATLRNAGLEVFTTSELERRTPSPVDSHVRQQHPPNGRLRPSTETDEEDKVSVWKRRQIGQYGIEVTSPALKFNEASLTDIRKAVHTLTTKLNVRANDSCGLHVHIGNQARGFPIPTLRAAGSIFAVFHRQLNTIHPLGRIANNQFAEDFADHIGFRFLTPFARAAAVYGATAHVEEISTLMCPQGRFYAYNFIPLAPGGKKTIEFRQHAASLDAERIVAWAETAAGLMRYAHHASPLQVTTLIFKHACDDSFDLFKLFRAIGMGSSHAAGYYAQYGLQSKMMTYREAEAYMKMKSAEVDMLEDFSKTTSEPADSDGQPDEHWQQIDEDLTEEILEQRAEDAKRWPESRKAEQERASKAHESVQW